MCASIAVIMVKYHWLAVPCYVLVMHGFLRVSVFVYIFHVYEPYVIEARYLYYNMGDCTCVNAVIAP